MNEIAIKFLTQPNLLTLSISQMIYHTNIQYSNNMKT
jgi:hypothetical protein